MNKMNWLDWTAFTLLIIGGINWGLVGFFNFNLVTAIFGTGILSGIIFAAVGLAALYAIYSLSKIGTMMSAQTGEGRERMRRAA